MAFNFGGPQGVPLRFQNANQNPFASSWDSPSPFYQPTFENNAMYLEDPSTTAHAMPTLFVPSCTFSFEDAMQQNPQIRKFSPGELQIGEVLGSGFFGQVHKGMLNNGTTVAVKRVLKDRFRDKNSAQMLSQEIEILSKVSHPSIVSLYGIALLNDNSYTMVLEYMSGGTLRNFIDKFPHALSNDRRVGIAKRIADGMNYLHSWKPEPIIHRDLSSMNILLDNNASAKICDFGLSRFKASGDTSMTSAVGAAAYMAPEVWHGGNYDQKADVFSFAIVCWELCTGGEVCGGLLPDMYAQRVALEGLRPVVTDNISPEWKNLITACWATDPRARPEFSQILFALSK